MTEVQKSWFAVFGAFVAVAGGIFATLQGGFFLYDRVTAPAVKVASEIYVSPHATPAGFGLIELNPKQADPNKPLSVRIEENTWLSRVTGSKSEITMVVKNTGGLPVTEVTLDLSDNFPIVYVDDDTGRPKVFRSPRTIDLETLRAGQKAN
ncbi:hypothetical protein KCU57_14925 [Xanthomonas translucens]|uniref:hypothetical protein n=1 Tax=Xanthomonas campestris pv. translucens TaxID=343 RepID=UPI001F284C30|nr:hypothetical protein [Xanthomonas translucens]UKE49999.1 hypothetical protein KCU57_14925 [Xanthomonas translucens]